jgi:putative ABC transport system substrate-binding protein
MDRRRSRLTSLARARAARRCGLGVRQGSARGCAQQRSQYDVGGVRQGLRELGYTEGRTILVEWRWTEGNADRAGELAAELVRLP